MYFLQRSNQPTTSIPPLYQTNILSLRNPAAKALSSNSSRICSRNNSLVTSPGGALYPGAMIRDNGLIPQCFKAVWGGLIAHSPWAGLPCLTDGSLHFICYGSSGGPGWGMSTFSPPGLTNRTRPAAQTSDWTEITLAADGTQHFLSGSGTSYSGDGYTLSFGALDPGGNPCWTITGAGTWYGSENSAILSSSYSDSSGTLKASAFRTTDTGSTGMTLSQGTGDGFTGAGFSLQNQQWSLFFDGTDWNLTLSLSGADSGWKSPTLTGTYMAFNTGAGYGPIYTGSPTVSGSGTLTVNGSGCSPDPTCTMLGYSNGIQGSIAQVQGLITLIVQTGTSTGAIGANATWSKVWRPRPGFDDLATTYNYLGSNPTLAGSYVVLSQTI